MSNGAVVDTGPLVAILRDREAAHGRCVATLRELKPPLLTCWPVLTEAAWLLRHDPGGVRASGALVLSAAVKLVPLDEVALGWMVALMERYAPIGAQLADAGVMYLAEREKLEIIFTLDRRDFLGLSNDRAAER